MLSRALVKKVIGLRTFGLSRRSQRVAVSGHEGTAYSRHDALFPQRQLGPPGLVRPHLEAAGYGLAHPRIAGDQMTLARGRGNNAVLCCRLRSDGEPGMLPGSESDGTSFCHE